MILKMKKCVWRKISYTHHKQLHQIKNIIFNNLWFSFGLQLEGKLLQLENLMSIIMYKFYWLEIFDILLNKLELLLGN